MLIPLIIFFAIFTQTTSGFGLALVSMPLLAGLLGIRTATPLIALVGATAEILMLARYRQAFNLRAVGRLSLASLAGIPLGVYFLRQIDATIVTRFLGLILLGYALYALFGPALPQLRHRAWAYGFGFVGGLLSGAYNTSGPPVVIYGACRQWPPAEFKSNLQGFFFLNSLMTIFTHSLSGNFTPDVWRYYVLALPAVALGLLAGFSLDKHLNPQRFRQIVLVLLVLLSLHLLV
jgi:uncharacterized membrane protein YfcA